VDVQKSFPYTVHIYFCSFSDQGSSLLFLTLDHNWSVLKHISPNCDRSLQRHSILLKYVTVIRPIFSSDSKYVLGWWPWNRTRSSSVNLGYVKIIRKLSVCRSVTRGSGNWHASSKTESLESCRMRWTAALAGSWALARICDQIFSG
jgi:hypothetical protein